MKLYEWRDSGMYPAPTGEWVKLSAVDVRIRMGATPKARDTLESLATERDQAQRALALAHAMLETVKAERDALQRQLAMADALLNRERQIVTPANDTDVLEIQIAKRRKTK